MRDLVPEATSESSRIKGCCRSLDGSDLIRAPQKPAALDCLRRNSYSIINISRPRSRNGNRSRAGFHGRVTAAELLHLSCRSVDATAQTRKLSVTPCTHVWTQRQTGVKAPTFAGRHLCCQTAVKGRLRLAGSASRTRQEAGREPRLLWRRARAALTHGKGRVISQEADSPATGLHSNTAGHSNTCVKVEERFSHVTFITGHDPQEAQPGSDAHLSCKNRPAAQKQPVRLTTFHPCTY